jgi:hypothetical protein
MAGLGYAPHVLSGDFNGDGYSDIIATGVWWWETLPIAFSNGDDSFAFSNLSSSFNAWTSQSNAKVVASDFNGDSLTDLAAVGGSGWTSAKMALSRGDGTFTEVSWQSDFNIYAGQAGVRVLAGDYDGDGLDDLTAVGGQGWNTIPVAFASRSGRFETATNEYQYAFTARSSVQGGTRQSLSSWYGGPWK